LCIGLKKKKAKEYRVQKLHCDYFWIRTLVWNEVKLNSKEAAKNLNLLKTHCFVIVYILNNNMGSRFSNSKLTNMMQTYTDLVVKYFLLFE